MKMQRMGRSRKYLQQEELLGDEYKELIWSLPRENGWVTSYLYQYEGFWHAAAYLEGVISCQKHFEARHDSDVFLITTPKSGTTWLKALIFTVMNRKQHPISSQSHPLLTHNPHDLVPFLEIKIYAPSPTHTPDYISSLPSPRLFATHMPYVSLPQSVKKSKLVYLCRNPKDTFVSLWHFTNKLRTPEMGTNDIRGVFQRFCDGVSLYGPFWDHVVQYWKMSKENPHGTLFLKYEDIKDHPALHLRRLADFLTCPFTAEEEESGTVHEILKFCSFDHLSALEINKTGKLSSGEDNNAFFRRGQVGDWKNYLSAEMVDKLDRITQHNFSASGLHL